MLISFELLNISYYMLGMDKKPLKYVADNKKALCKGF
jgi:hypothetical protein